MIGLSTIHTRWSTASTSGCCCFPSMIWRALSTRITCSRTWKTKTRRSPPAKARTRRQRRGTRLVTKREAKSKRFAQAAERKFPVLSFSRFPMDATQRDVKRPDAPLLRVRARVRPSSSSLIRFSSSSFLCVPHLRPSSSSFIFVSINTVLFEPCLRVVG